MPKTKLDKLAADELPPIDLLRAMILERKAVKGLDLKQMASIACVSYERMRHLILQSPWDWPRNIREKVCANLGISINVTSEGIKIGGCQ